MTLTPQQSKTLDRLKLFVEDPATQVFVLRGYAGTGKTTLIGQLIAYLKSKKRDYKLLATTGRAAKVLSNKTKAGAMTVHKCIYAFDELIEYQPPHQAESNGQLVLNFSLRGPGYLEDDTVLIVDESSMIAKEENINKVTQSLYGSGNLLNDLFAFVENRKLIFVGDPCQLPPVSKDPFSAALHPEYLANTFGVKADWAELTTIMRQNAESEILACATPFRKDVVAKRFTKYPKIRNPRGQQVYLVDGSMSLLNKYMDILKTKNYEQSIMIGFSNWQINQINGAIRETLFGKPELQESELLMIVQNNALVPLVNGDQVVLEKVERHGRRAGLNFLKVTVTPLHNQDDSFQTLLIEDLLYNKEPNLSKDQIQSLIIDFDNRMRAKGISRNSDLYKENMKEDRYLNALRAKFGYAITCHKSQGGEWPEVYLNIHKSLYRMRDEQLYRWYYTALTRASDQLYVNDGFWVWGFNDRLKEQGIY